MVTLLLQLFVNSKEETNAMKIVVLCVLNGKKGEKGDFINYINEDLYKFKV